jgi:hypothetical protein
VPASNHTGLPLEVLNFDVKNHVAFNPLVVKGRALAWVQTFESNGHVFHLFGNGIFPKGVAIALVNVKSMVNQGWNLNPKLHVLLKVAHLLLLNKGNDVLVELQNLWNSPVECRLVVNANSLCNGTFSHL